MILTKRSRKLLLSAGMLAAVAAIPPTHKADASCSVTCRDGSTLYCNETSCHPYPQYFSIVCGRANLVCGR